MPTSLSRPARIGKYAVGQRVSFYWKAQKKRYVGIIMKIVRRSSVDNCYELKLLEYNGGAWSVTASPCDIQLIVEPNDALREML